MNFQLLTILSIFTICSCFPERVVNSMNQQMINSNVKQSGVNDKAIANSDNSQKLIAETIVDAAAQNAQVNSQNVQNLDSVINSYKKRKELFDQIMNSLNDQNLFSKLVLGNANANKNVINSNNNQDINSVMLDKFGSAAGGRFNSLNEQGINSLVDNAVVGDKKGDGEMVGEANVNNAQLIDAVIDVTFAPTTMTTPEASPPTVSI